MATLHLPTLDAELIVIAIPQVQFLDKLDTPVMRVFFDQVVDVPVVLCNGIPQVQFIGGCDVPMIMRG